MDEWTALHFSQANQEGERQDDVPALLRRVADSLATLGDAEVMDIVFHNEGDRPTMTVYYYRPEEER